MGVPARAVLRVADIEVALFLSEILYLRIEEEAEHIWLYGTVRRLVRASLPVTTCQFVMR
jgi:hypothetical protein